MKARMHHKQGRHRQRVLKAVAEDEEVKSVCCRIPLELTPLLVKYPTQMGYSSI